MNVMTKVNEVRDCVIKKAVPLSISACAAVNALMISAFAEESTTGSTVDISTVTDTLSTSLTDLVNKVMVVCAGLVGAALSVFAIKYAIRVVKSFFNKISG